MSPPDQQSPAASGDAALRELLRLRSPSGVVTLYVDTSPEQRGAAQPAWETATRAELHRLRRQVHAEGDHKRSTGLARRLDQLEPDLERLIDPRQPGRGRALFFTIDGPEVRSVSTSVPLPTRLVVGDAPDLRPLLAALELERPAGIADISQAGLRLIEWANGRAHELPGLAHDRPAIEWQERKEPAGTLRDDELHLVNAAAPAVQKAVRTRGWGRLILCGNHEMAREVARRLRTDGELVLRTVPIAPLAEMTAHAVAAGFADALAGMADERHRQQAEQAVAAAEAGGAGAAGLDAVLQALQEGRVRTLLLDRDRAYTGATSTDGRLLTARMASSSGESVTTEPQLAERMIEQALDSDAVVSVVSGGAAAALDDHDGVAALLRW
ncbi:MAG: baeRF10 domain-containing protein [Gaiellales bacterium]